MEKHFTPKRDSEKERERTRDGEREREFLPIPDDAEMFSGCSGEKKTGKEG